MAHQAIYRKWRPMTFDDIIGQQHITKTLKNQILSDSVGHAYLFCGTRGTGKTTCAKVLSRAVNCLNPQNGNPCNECAVCRGIIDGSIMDVAEIDAASNNGVDNIREIREDINYVASNAKYTVYIIDEVHMLSSGAFNALLKTLEEPPENVIFILATTEAHKVPQTILSRCQRFDFKRIKSSDIIVRMKEIAHADGYNITDGAYRLLASLAEGSLRDGLSIMERVIASGGGTVDETTVTRTLGISSRAVVFELTDAVIAGDSAAIISTLDKTLADGKELSQLADSMLAHFRSLMLCKLSEKPETLIDCDADTLVRLKAQSDRLSFEKIDHASSLIAKATSDARTAKSARIIYELAFIKLTRPELDRTPEGVMNRISVIEQKLEYGVPAAPAPTQQSDEKLLKRVAAIEDAIKNGIKPTPSTEEKPKQKKKVSSRLYVPIPPEKLNFDYPTARLARNWSSTIETMIQQNVPLAVPLKNCVATFDAEGLIITVPREREDFTMRTAAAHIDLIRELFQKITGTSYNIKIVARRDLDERYIINPFTLPKGSGANEPEAEPEPEQPPEPARDEAPQDNRFDEFIAKFADIINDGDTLAEPFSGGTDTGRQASMEDTEGEDFEDDEPEEFLTESELSSQNADDESINN